MTKQSEGLVLEFYQQQHEALLRFLCRKLGSMSEAADVAQQTYEKLLKSEQVDQINNPKAFVYKMAANLAIDTMRKRSRTELSVEEEADEIELLPGSGSSPEDIVSSEQVILLIRQFISELPPKCRYAFLSYKFEDNDYKEIADQLGVSESMIRKYVLRAMAYCRDRLEQCEWPKNIRKQEKPISTKLDLQH